MWQEGLEKGIGYLLMALGGLLTLIELVSYEVTPWDYQGNSLVAGLLLFTLGSFLSLYRQNKGSPKEMAKRFSSKIAGNTLVLCGISWFIAGVIGCAMIGEPPYALGIGLGLCVFIIGMCLRYAVSPRRPEE